ncbi:carboxypeptidase-like regulatory domain-containing protein [Myroides guanonis]|uniref:Carboxypeptidase regulatory-like domain-containing protein n=1 Tax=Myroides guanonis TaxID=1150112 RepID=A0A1I3V177_9FLAO|nr:carboxypeptidase-like regulatory domain-containing protein [Myroides guanonis]SFJ88995.1 Carboxypeptidase regulatory-like domain-containing protein [Myroides guanonis]
MKNTFIRNLMILILVIISGAIYAQKKETITITGRVTVKDTGKPPLGVITVLEKGVAEHMVFGDVIGTNRHTFIQKDGTFKFTINKGGSIIITDKKHRYMPHGLRNLDKSQAVNVELRRIPNFEKSAYPPNELHKLESRFDVTKRVKISGRVTDKGGKGLTGVYITQSNVFNENEDMAFSTTNKNGEFSCKVLKGGHILIGAKGYELLELNASKDTVVNVKLKLVNPFK